MSDVNDEILRRLGGAWQVLPGLAHRLARLLHGVARRAVPHGSSQERWLLPVWHLRRASRRRPIQPAPVVLEGGLDLPPHGGNVFGTLEVAGWAFSQAGAIEQIQIYLSGEFLGDATYGWLRPDVVAARPH